MARPGDLDALVQAGLVDPLTWHGHLSRGAISAGRGAVGKLVLPDGRAVILKALRRGGWLASFSKDRFVGGLRLIENLTLPEKVLARGIPTPSVLGLLLSDPAPFRRGFIAVEEIEASEDLRTRLQRDPVPDERYLGSVAAFLKLVHDRGLEHRDLHPANLLVQDLPEGTPRIWVLDLDGARLHDGPLPPRLRRTSLRRFERYHLKWLSREGRAAGWAPDRWSAAYAENDPEIARYLEAHRWAERLKLALHARGWKR